MPDISNRPNMMPILRYADASAALEWLAKAFGFEKLVEVPDPNGTIMHAEMSYGSGAIMFGQARGDLPPRRTAETFDPATVEGVYVAVTDVDAHCERARAAGATIVMEPTDMDYGSREYGALDLEGKFWSFGTYQP